MATVTSNTEFVIGIYLGRHHTSASLCNLNTWEKFDLDILPGQKVITSAVAILERKGHRDVFVGDAAIERAPIAKEFQMSFEKRPSEMSKSDCAHMVAFMKGVYAGILERYPDFRTREHVVYIAYPSLQNFCKSDETVYLKIADEAGIPVVGFQNKTVAALFRASTQPDAKLDNEMKKGVILVDYSEDSIQLSYVNDSLLHSIYEEFPLGSCQVEKSLLEYALTHPLASDNVMHQFVEMYGKDENSNPYKRLLCEFREAKETFYRNKLPEFCVILDYGALTYLEKQQLFGFGTIRISKQQIDKILGKNIKGGYIQNVRDAVLAFKDKKLKGNQVSYVYLTGGASRMDFVRGIFMDVFRLDDNHCVRDDNPGTIISQGVASLSCALIKAKKNKANFEDSFWGRLITLMDNQLPSVNNNDLTNTMKEVTRDTEFVIGIDFGHGETSAAFYSLRSMDDKLDLDILPGQKVIKSAVAIMEQEEVPTISVGDAAVANAPMAKVFQVSFKKRPSEMSSTERDLMVAFMKGVYAGIIDQHPDYRTREHVVYIARPSQDELWKSEESEYLKIAQDAGLPVAGIQKESRAAYFRARTQPDSKIDTEVKKGVLIVDFGSSTIDFTYLNESLSSPIDGGCPLGASQVEKSLMEYAFEHPVIQDDAMHQFIKTYGMDEKSIPYNRLLFKFRKKKEDYYKNKLPSFEGTEKVPL